MTDLCSVGISVEMYLPHLTLQIILDCILVSITHEQNKSPNKVLRLLIMVRSNGSHIRSTIIHSTGNNTMTVDSHLRRTGLVSPAARNLLLPPLQLFGLYIGLSWRHSATWMVFKRFFSFPFFC